MRRRALIIGINEYKKTKSLKGCINDANDLNEVLERHDNNDDKEKNFETDLITTDTHNISRSYLRDKIEELFKFDREISLLYFSGHGHIENTGGYLMTPECIRGDDGVSMNDILVMANESPATNKIIILDCCHSGAFAINSLNKNVTSIGEGVTILAASAKDQYSIEKNGTGVFTELLIHALEGGAANLLGEVTSGAIYGYIDKAMGEKSQRPIFATNVRSYTTLRKVYTQIKLNELRQITSLFDNGPKIPFNLNPTFEEESDEAILKNVEKFKILQQYNRVNLVVPVDAPHMFHAAMESKSCKLTSLGKSYWFMVKNNII